MLKNSRFLLPPVWTLTRNVANQPFKTCRVQLLTYLHVSAHDRIELWALPEWLRDGGQPFLWRGRGGGRRLCHVKQPLQQPHQHVAGGSPWRQGRGSTQRDHKAQVSSGAFFWMDCWPPPQTPVLLSAPHHEMNKPDRGLVSSYRTVILAFSFLLSCNPDVLVSGCGLFPNLLALFSQWSLFLYFHVIPRVFSTS